MLPKPNSYNNPFPTFSIKKGLLGSKILLPGKAGRGGGADCSPAPS